ncbi:MAG: hypothetical protein AAF633_08275 [Chloroflexota bacterium]
MLFSRRASIGSLTALLIVVVAVCILSIWAARVESNVDANFDVYEGATQEQAWAFEETFDGHPSSPSQDALPRNFNYVITHRSHPQEHFTKEFGPYPADHDDNCAGPNPEVVPLPQHMIISDHKSSNSDPDDSFFICHNHMMTAIGEVAAYSVSAFWPRQEFDFSDGGTLEFDVNINRGHTFRHWFEVMIVPRDQVRFGAGPVDSPIDETYPEDRIVMEFRRNTRGIKVGTGAIAPEGWLVNERDFGQYDYNYWYAEYPDDPAVGDRRIRRTMRIRLEGESVIWGIEKEDGTFDEYAVDVPGGLPFDRGLVLFKTHSYTPSKDRNVDDFTFHWDNIRFDGPVVGLHDAYDADDVVYLQANGDRQVGESETVNINIPDVGDNPILIGQINQPKKGQVLLSINGQPDILVNPRNYTLPGCMSRNWNTFQMEIDPSLLQAGNNTFKWTIGPSPGCETHEYDWDGFSVKSLQIQMDSEGGSSQPEQPDEPEQPGEPEQPEQPEPEPTPSYPGPNFDPSDFQFLPFMTNATISNFFCAIPGLTVQVQR